MCRKRQMTNVQSQKAAAAKEIKVNEWSRNPPNDSKTQPQAWDLLDGMGHVDFLCDPFFPGVAFLRHNRVLYSHLACCKGSLPSYSCCALYFARLCGRIISDFLWLFSVICKGVWLKKTCTTTFPHFETRSCHSSQPATAMNDRISPVPQRPVRNPSTNAPAPLFGRRPPRPSPTPRRPESAVGIPADYGNAPGKPHRGT